MRYVLGFCALAIVLILYQSLVVIPRENAEQATSQQMIQANERSDCASEAKSTAVIEYRDTYCSYILADCSNGNYLISQYNDAYSECLQEDGLIY